MGWLEKEKVWETGLLGLSVGLSSEGAPPDSGRVKSNTLWIKDKSGGGKRDRTDDLFAASEY